MTFGRTGPARRTSEVKRLRTREYILYDDGSWRRRYPKLKGKAAIKVAKRARHRQQRLAAAA